MKVRCNNLESLQFLRLLPQQNLGELRKNTCWQQIKMISPRFKEEVLLTEVRLLFETYLDYTLKSSDKDMTEVEKQLDRLEGILDLEGKLPMVYRPIVERCTEDEGKKEIEEILQTLRELREAKEQEVQECPAHPRKPTKGRRCCQSETSMA